MEVIAPFWWLFGLVATFLIVSAKRFGDRTLILSQATVSKKGFGGKWASHRINHSVEMKAMSLCLALSGIFAIICLALKVFY